MSAPVNREALIELIAKADDGVDIDEAWDECGEEMRRAYTEHAAVILAAIEAPAAPWCRWCRRKK